MSVQVVKPGDVLVVQVPASWTIRDIRLEQGRVGRYIEKVNAGIKIIIVGGGSEPQILPSVQSLIAKSKGDDNGDDDDEFEDERELAGV